jgi:hypothetical protein
MANLYELLKQPQSFEDMTSIIRTKDIIKKTKQLLDSKNVNVSPNLFLAGWLIARFPETIENTPDELLQTSANALVECCKNNYEFVQILNIFKSRFNSWKEQDISKLKEEFLTNYKYLCNQQLKTPESAEILENTKTVILNQAKKIGGQSFVNQLLEMKIHK